MAEKNGESIPDFKIADHLNADQIKGLVQYCIDELNSIDVIEMTTFELSFLRKFCANPPPQVTSVD